MLRSRLVRRERTDVLLKPFARLRLHPIAWSLLSLPFAFAGMLLLGRGELIPGLLMFLASGAMDVIDGAVARATSTVTLLGAYVDGVLDRYVEILLILGLMLYLGDRVNLRISLLFSILIFGSLMTSFVRAYADHRGLVRDQEELMRMGGFLERAERLMLLYACIISGLYSTDLLIFLLTITALLANLTVIQRIFLILNYARRSSGR
ncbi:MAG: CDP-alcohol phosphatidyltransferase family protein [Methanothrix sp.]|jgi:phosphatidylglycerophosphate synthase|uniref:CDP-alcohol phosphatidyltransferase n=1 Tax=Methanothrix thermoacetophila (strain DSM 6194 / JCM 14653 / NBRC 101360 / PT) TaxID=349307 RepID=A0B7J5_METTP|nr:MULTISPECIES: CDP-alcohol phosphatidyltransferase family protein [Methanothrix]ABK14669.1 CDP-alcohol phosphatidyltransferase [Methanothrix thermoacetophila PT]MBC7079061.1 CDP-alcohol phosphatidyltransferase family protein [Methanothrix sp.]NPU87217.1 CDP-alcohol phosphatidyltransferase family protein [Methanothrix sp.]